MTLYVVNSGYYSEYHIDYIASTQKKAEEYIQHHGADYSIEEYELDEEFDRDDKQWMVSLFTDGTTRCVRKDYRFFEDGVTAQLDTERHKSCYVLWVKTDTMERAIKIASERLAQVKALQEVKYPQLYEDVRKRMSAIELLHYSGGKRYPVYNFFSGEIIGKY